MGPISCQGFVDGSAVINEAGCVMINGAPHMLEAISYDAKRDATDSGAATCASSNRTNAKYVFSQAAASPFGMLQVTEPAGVLSIVTCWGYPQLVGNDYPLHFRAEMSGWIKERDAAFSRFCAKKHLDPAAFGSLFGQTIYT